jgi:hypothetical protein
MTCRRSRRRRGAFDVAADFAKIILYRPRFRRGVPMAGMPEFGWDNATYARILAADLLLMQLTAGAAQPWIAIEAFARGKNV